MKPVGQNMRAKQAGTAHKSQKSVVAEEVFLPSVIEIVKHLARVAAETDYSHFVATGNAPCFKPERETGDD